MVNTHRERYLRRMGMDTKKSYSLAELSRVSGVPQRILQQVYNRGIGAARTNPTSVRLKSDFSKNPNPAIPRSARLSDENWASARVYSFLNKGTTYKTTDSDLAREAGY
jgi:hypothetical protein